MTNYTKALTKVMNTLLKMGFELPMGTSVELTFVDGRGSLDIKTDNFSTGHNTVELGDYESAEVMLAFLADGRKSAHFLKKAILNTVQVGEFQAEITTPEVPADFVADEEYQQLRGDMRYTHDEDGKKLDKPSWGFSYSPIKTKAKTKTKVAPVVAEEAPAVTEAPVVAVAVAAPTYAECRADAHSPLDERSFTDAQLKAVGIHRVVVAGRLFYSDTVSGNTITPSV